MKRFAKPALVLFFTMGLMVHSHSAQAAVVFGTNGNLGGGSRWDAAPRTVAGNERSLDGGLRYSLQGGSYQAFRDLFSWNVLPTVAQFQQAVEDAFAAWEAVDPVSGLGTALAFVPDFQTAVVGTAGFGGLDIDGAEIDVFGVDARDAGTRGVASFGAVNVPLTLTSGTTNYSGFAISGADVYINANPGATYSLDLFRRLLTHELGHAIGLGDVEDFFGNGFIDDNYDGTSSATALATLTNPWAGLVNPLDPSNSPGLTQFVAGTVANGDPGIDTPGVDILMESQGLGIAAGNPVTNLVPLQNDDYGGRQFLYPTLANISIPEPATGGLILFGIAGLAKRRRRIA